MPTFSAAKTYQDGTILIETDLNNLWNSTTSFFNLTKLDSSNFQATGLTGANFANGTLTTDNLANSAATTAKFPDNAVTPAKLQALNSVFGTPLFNQAYLATGSIQTVTSVSLSVSGLRPVFIGLREYNVPPLPTGGVYVSGNTNNPQQLSIIGSGTSSGGYLAQFEGLVISFAPTEVWAANTFWFIDYPAVGTATYTLKIEPAYLSTSFRDTVTFYAQLFAIEL